MTRTTHDFSAAYPLEHVVRKGKHDGRGWFWDWSPPFYHSPGPVPRHLGADANGKVPPPAYLAQMAEAAGTEIKQLMREWADEKGILTQQGAALAASIPGGAAHGTPTQERAAAAARTELARLCEAYESGFERRSREARVVQDEFRERCSAYRAASDEGRANARRRDDRTAPLWDDPVIDLPQEFIAKQPVESWTEAIGEHRRPGTST